MVIKIGGIEIDDLSNVKEINQLRVGLDELGIDTPIEAFEWLRNLSGEELINFLEIIGSNGIDTFTNIFTMGIF